MRRVQGLRNPTQGAAALIAAADLWRICWLAEVVGAESGPSASTLSSCSPTSLIRALPWGHLLPLCDI